MGHKNANYGGLPKVVVMSIYDFAMKLRQDGNGQRTICREIRREFDVDISENTISGWIHQSNVPFAQEQTQFRPLPVPPRDILYDLYKIKNLSASEIAHMYQVSTIIVINWLRSYGIEARNHVESMNTNRVREVLRAQKLRWPTKDYSQLTAEKAYILGVLAGDGHINDRNIQLEIRKDLEFGQEFSRCLAQVYGLQYKCYYYEKSNTYRVYAASMIISEDLLNHGNFSTYTWKVPEVISNAKDELIIGSYLRGIFDSEGCVTKYTIRMSSVSGKGIRGVHDLLLVLGITSKIYLFRKKYYTLYIGREANRRRFSNKVGFTIERKRRILHDNI